MRARLRNERGGGNDLVGIVYLYFDPANYDEVVFSPLESHTCKNAPWGKRIQFGQVGFSTYNTTARFNKISISLPWGQQAFIENFSDGVAAGFDSANGAGSTTSRSATTLSCLGRRHSTRRS